MSNLYKEVPQVVTIIATLGILCLIVLILFGNLSGNVGFTNTKAITYTNESGFINTTGYTPTHATDTYALSYAIVEIGGNYTVEGGYFVIPASNYTKTGSVLYNNSGVLDLTEYGYVDAGITYTVTYNGDDYQNTQAVIGNVTSGTVSLFSVVPTVFKIAGLLLIFAVVFLIWNSFKGGIGKKDKFAN